MFKKMLLVPSLILPLVSALASGLVVADTVVEDYLQTPIKHGEADYKAMMWKIYRAELYSGDEVFSMDQPYALKLTYARDIKGEDISDKSIELIRRQGVEDEVLLATWHSQLDAIFPDVSEGTEIVGTHQKGEGAVFYVDGVEAGSLADPELCRHFFGIWLAEDTKKPKLRARLLGEDVDT